MFHLILLYNNQQDSTVFGNSKLKSWEIYQYPSFLKLLQLYLQLFIILSITGHEYNNNNKKPITEPWIRERNTKFTPYILWNIWKHETNLPCNKNEKERNNIAWKHKRESTMPPTREGKD